MGLMATVYGQFKRPHGPLGVLAGLIMANRGSNRERNLWTVSLLEIEPDDRVLKIGFGPGLAIGALAERARRGFVVGIDHCATMLRQARRRNRSAITAGRVELRLGEIQGIPAEMTFDKILAVDVVQFWPDWPLAFQAIRNHLAPHGRVAITYQPRHANATAEDARQMAVRVRNAMVAAGIERSTIAELPLRPVPAICVIGRRARAAASGAGGIA